MIKKTLKKAVVTQGIVLVLVLMTAGCSLFGIVSEEEAEKVAEKVMTAFSSAVSEAMAEAMSGARDVGRTAGPVGDGDAESRAAQSFSYRGSGVSASGSMDYTDSSSVSYRMKFTFTGYSKGTVRLMGSADYSYTISGSAISGSYDGKFTVAVDGRDYDFSWDYSLSGSGITGTYKVNGQTFSCNNQVPAPSAGGGNGNDTGGDDPSATTGQICIWTSAKVNSGYIDVYLDGSYIGQLTRTFETGVPVFGQSGTVTVTRPPGTYSLRAQQNATGYTWTDTFTLKKGDRRLFHLRG